VAAARLVRRGAEIFLLAFLFRAQAFVVSPGNPLTSLLRVDILNIMGPAMMGSAALWGLSAGPRTAALASAAAASLIALVTPPIRTAGWIGLLPGPLQWYVTPSGSHSTFTLFPWAAFVMAGAAYGSVLAPALWGDERRTVWRLGQAGAVLALGSYALSMRPSIYTASSFWTTSPTYFGLRVGVLMMVLATLFAIAPATRRIRGPFAALAHLGQHSLFVYWIHVELVYGYATIWIHRRLPLWGTALAYAGFVLLMYWAIALRDAVVERWHRTAGGASGRNLEIGSTT
jgi:uncharacterized membrane protein